MSEAPNKRRRNQRALVLAIGWTLFVALLLLWSSGFAGGIGPMFRGSPLVWILAASVTVPILRWLFSRAP